MGSKLPRPTVPKVVAVMEVITRKKEKIFYVCYYKYNAVIIILYIQHRIQAIKAFAIAMQVKSVDCNENKRPLEGNSSLLGNR